MLIFVMISSILSATLLYENLKSDSLSFCGHFILHLRREMFCIFYRHHKNAVVYDIGKSVKGRFLYGIRIGSSGGERELLKPMVKIVANMHGNEVNIKSPSKAGVSYIFDCRVFSLLNVALWSI
jgi:hypothetical protein